MQQSALTRLLAAAASLRLTLGGMVLLAGGVLAASEGGGTGWIAPPLFLLAGNLLAAMAVHPRLRRQGPLLGLHVSLLLLAALAGYGQLTAFHGRFELSEGQSFDPALVITDRQGPWHRLALPAGLFEQGPVAVAYRAGMVRGTTRSQLRVADAEGHRQPLEVGDDRPLVHGGYRFYTTPNKGFAVRLRWQSRDGTVARGAVHLPSYPLLALEQRNGWQTPAGEAVMLHLELPEPPPEGREWVLTGAGEGVRLRVSAATGEGVLAPGESELFEQERC